MSHLTNQFLIASPLLFCFWSCSEQKSNSLEGAIEILEGAPTEGYQAKGYDEELAQQLGADEYGMKSYVMAFLKAGPNRDQDTESAEAMQAAHMANIKKMAEEGILILAGPFLDEGELRGIYLFDVETIEEAEALTASDPAIQAGRLSMELHPWHGSAALMQVSEVHQRLTKTPM